MEFFEAVEQLVANKWRENYRLGVGSAWDVPEAFPVKVKRTRVREKEEGRKGKERNNLGWGTRGLFGIIYLFSRNKHKSLLWISQLFTPTCFATYYLLPYHLFAFIAILKIAPLILSRCAIRRQFRIVKWDEKLRHIFWVRGLVADDIQTAFTEDIFFYSSPKNRRRKNKFYLFIFLLSIF